MKLYIKQKVFSWNDKFTVKDEAGNDRYYVEGEILSLGKKLHVYDAGRREVAFIRQKLISFMPRFHIEVGGRTLEIVQEWGFRPRFRFEGLPWRLSGDFMAYNYELSDGSQCVMRLEKRWLSWGDTYEMDIAGQADETLCLCVALVVDCVLAMRQS